MAHFEDTYAENMQRDPTEAQRLDEQFNLLTQSIGYMLHPCVQSKMHRHARVADVATGTAAFLRDLAREWPHAVLHGFDMSSSLYPPILPLNVTLYLFDVRNPIPTHLHGKYDIVHIRMIVAGLKPSQWAEVVRNLVQLLKPGGAMQWEECDFTNVRHLPRGPHSTTETASAMGAMFMRAMKPLFESGWDRLATEMRAAGLVGVNTEIVAADRAPGTRKLLTANGMAAIFNWARGQSARGSNGALTMEQLDELERKAFADIRSGCYVKFDIHVVWGFAPEEKR